MSLGEFCIHIFYSSIKKKNLSQVTSIKNIYYVDNGNFDSLHAITFGKRKCIQWLSCVQHMHLVWLLFFMSPFNLGQKTNGNNRNVNKQLKMLKYFLNSLKCLLSGQPSTVEE